ncbi:MAG: DinB family protein [Candidatus Methylomirabilales bacterium]
MRGLSPSAAARLETQLEGALPLLLDTTTPEALTGRPASGKWSAHENLAHLARHHQVFLERVQRMLAEDTPHLPRYRAEEDPAWPTWAALPTDEVVRRLQALRRDLIALVNNLSPGQLNRTGVHPRFGEMTIPMWIEFFLLHEAHHLYVALTRIRGS